MQQLLTCRLAARACCAVTISRWVSQGGGVSLTGGGVVNTAVHACNKGDAVDAGMAKVVDSV
jgi:hypothetical protein